MCDDGVDVERKLPEQLADGVIPHRRVLANEMQPWAEKKGGRMRERIKSS